MPPILPAVVKSELKDLLALSPVLLSDFEKAFAKRFGRSFQYMQYGFLSMFEVLNAASDVISVEQTRAGSLLTLKKSVIEDKHRGWPAGKLVSIHNCVTPTNLKMWLPKQRQQQLIGQPGGDISEGSIYAKVNGQLMAVERKISLRG